MNFIFLILGEANFGRVFWEALGEYFISINSYQWYTDGHVRHSRYSLRMPSRSHWSCLKYTTLTLGSTAACITWVNFTLLESTSSLGGSVDVRALLAPAKKSDSLGAIQTLVVVINQSLIQLLSISDTECKWNINQSTHSKSINAIKSISR